VSVTRDWYSVNWEGGTKPYWSIEFDLLKNLLGSCQVCSFSYSSSFYRSFFFYELMQHLIAINMIIRGVTEMTMIAQRGNGGVPGLQKPLGLQDLL
jgi:hypothetical protein